MTVHRLRRLQARDGRGPFSGRISGPLQSAPIVQRVREPEHPGLHLVADAELFLAVFKPLAVDPGDTERYVPSAFWMRQRSLVSSS